MNGERKLKIGIFIAKLAMIQVMQLQCRFVLLLPFCVVGC